MLASNPGRAARQAFFEWRPQIRGFPQEKVLHFSGLGTCGLEALVAMSSAPRSDDVDLSRPNPREQLIDGLRRQLGRWEAAGAPDDAAVFSCGASSIDRLLPGGGLRQGMLIEWLNSSNIPAGSGAATLGLLGAREACGEGGALVVI